MIFVLIGLVSGAVGVGFSTMRTIYTIEGNYFKAPGMNVLASLNIFLMTYLVADMNYPYMISNIIGASLSVAYIAWKRRDKE